MYIGESTYFLISENWVTDIDKSSWFSDIGKSSGFTDIGKSIYYLIWINWTASIGKSFSDIRNLFWYPDVHKSNNQFIIQCTTKTILVYHSVYKMGSWRLVCWRKKHPWTSAFSGNPHWKVIGCWSISGVRTDQCCCKQVLYTNYFDLPISVNQLIF